MLLKNIEFFLIIAIISYSMGSFNGAIIASHLKHNSDVRERGSGNAGLTNFYRNYGKKGIVLVFVIDIVKVIVAVIAGGIIWSNVGDGCIGQTIAMLFAILGHSFPIPYDFRGGKGVLSTCGAIFVIDYRVLLVMLLIFFITVFITRYVSLGSMLMVMAMPFIYYLFDRDITCSIVLLVVSIIIVFMHRGNIKRLIKCEESKLVFRKD